MMEMAYPSILTGLDCMERSFFFMVTGFYIDKTKFKSKVQYQALAVKDISGQLPYLPPFF
jgi:hypothetical protein